MPNITKIIISCNIKELDVKVNVSWFNGIGGLGIWPLYFISFLGRGYSKGNRGGKACQPPLIILYGTCCEISNGYIYFSIYILFISKTTGA